MRHFYSSITPTVIFQHCHDALERCLPWRPFRQSVSVPQLLSLLLLMAAHASSLSAIVRRFFSFSHETARRAVKAQALSQPLLVKGLVDALHNVLLFSRQDRRRHWLLAIDYHNVPYYGQHTADVVGGPKKHGTHWSFSYATAVLLHDRRRYTVALCPVAPKQKVEHIVRTLLDQIAAKGLKIKGVALDSGFDSGEVLLLLQERGLAYTVPLRRNGKGSNARNRYFEGRHNLIRWASWRTEATRRQVHTRVLLWKTPQRVMAFAFAGWSGTRARHLYQTAKRQQRAYQQRFGIETSYRQKNQAEAKTTSRDPAYRLLLEGIAYLLRQVWVALTAELARRGHLPADAWVAALPFARLLEWLASELEQLYPESRSIPLDPIT